MGWLEGYTKEEKDKAISRLCFAIPRPAAYDDIPMGLRNSTQDGWNPDLYYEGIAEQFLQELNRLRKGGY